jgi:hypothetical protein
VVINDLFGGEDFFELSLVGCLAHPLRLGNVAFEAACSSELATQLKSPPQSALMGGFALVGVRELVSLARGERECAPRQVEFGDPLSCPWAYEPQRLPPKGWRGLELDPVIGFMSLTVPPGRCVFEPDASGFLAKKGFVAD